MIKIEDLEITDYVEYFDEKTDIIIFPNNDVEEVAEILEDHGFSMADVLYNAKNYRKVDDVLWISPTRFGTWGWWELDEQYGDKVVEWLESKKNAECKG